MKNDVNNDGIRVQAVDSRRIGKIRPSLSALAVAPPTHVICRKPPKELQNMRSANFGNLMPNDAASRSRSGARSFNHVVHVFDMLGIEMNFPAKVRRKALDLFRDAPLSSMTSVKKGGNHRDSHVMPS
jgi:hypothetical protein